jgi:hypothetical protein
MKLLQTNMRKNRIIKELRKSIKWYRDKLSEINNIYSDREKELWNQKEDLKEDFKEHIKFLQTENEQLLEFKVKYYNLIKNLK